MNFSFEIDDIVALKNTDGRILYVLVKGFDPTPSGHRVWWLDPIDTGKPNPNKRIRKYSSELVRVRRPKEEARLAERARRWKERRVIAAMLRRAREEIKREAARRRRGVKLNDLPYRIPVGKWVSPEGVRQILTDLGFKPETIDKRVRIMERLFGK